MILNSWNQITSPLRWYVEKITFCQCIKLWPQFLVHVSMCGRDSMKSDRKWGFVLLCMFRNRLLLSFCCHLCVKITLISKRKAVLKINIAWSKEGGMDYFSWASWMSYFQQQWVSRCWLKYHLMFVCGFTVNCRASSAVCTSDSDPPYMVFICFWCCHAVSQPLPSVYVSTWIWTNKLQLTQ